VITEAIRKIFVSIDKNFRIFDKQPDLDITTLNTSAGTGKLAE